MLVSNLFELGILVRNVVYGFFCFEFVLFWYNFLKDLRNFGRDFWVIFEVCFCGVIREFLVLVNESLFIKGVICFS